MGRAITDDRAAIRYSVSTGPRVPSNFSTVVCVHAPVNSTDLHQSLLVTAVWEKWV